MPKSTASSRGAKDNLTWILHRLPPVRLEAGGQAFGSCPGEGKVPLWCGGRVWVQGSQYLSSTGRGNCSARGWEWAVWAPSPLPRQTQQARSPGPGLSRRNYRRRHAQVPWNALVSLLQGNCSVPGAAPVRS